MSRVVLGALSSAESSMLTFADKAYLSHRDHHSHAHESRVQKFMSKFDSGRFSASARYGNDGKIGKIELGAAGIGYWTRAELEQSRILRHGVGNGDGFINPQELESLVNLGVVAFTEKGGLKITDYGQRQLDTFRSMDMNANGIITREEYISTMRRRSPYLGARRASRMFDTMFGKGAAAKDSITFEQFATRYMEDGSKNSNGAFFLANKFGNRDGFLDYRELWSLRRRGVVGRARYNSQADVYDRWGRGFKVSGRGVKKIATFERFDVDRSGYLSQREHNSWKVEAGKVMSVQQVSELYKAQSRPAIVRVAGSNGFSSVFRVSSETEGEKPSDLFVPKDKVVNERCFPEAFSFDSFIEESSVCSGISKNLQIHLDDGFCIDPCQYSGTDTDFLYDLSMS